MPPDATPAPAKPPKEPLPAATWRYMPPTRPLRVGLAFAAALLLGYFIFVLAVRYGALWDRWSCDGDQPQAVWHYWRYNVDDAFPPGDFLTDYAFVVHAPPIYWAIMATMSTIMSPLVAAKILNIIAVLGGCIMMWLAVSRRSNAILGCLAATLLLRDFGFTATIAGGYARSFGPMLTLMFLSAFLMRAHRACLVILVLQAGFYPSVVMPCGLAYGIYCLFAGPTMRERVKRLAGLAVCGMLVIGFGEANTLRAPEWWGKLVSYEEARKMPEWGPGGRVPETPLRPLRTEITRNAMRAYHPTGHVPFPKLSAKLNGLPSPLAFFVLPITACGVVWFVRRRQKQPIPEPFPWEIPLLAAAAFCAFLLARHMAFKLYLPYRPIQHVWPYLSLATIPLAAWTLTTAFVRNHARATAIAAFITIASVGIAYGDGLEPGPRNYASHAQHAKLYNFVRTLPIDSVLAGEIAIVDKTQLFAFHKSYVTRNLAQPFYPGFYREAERRMIAMHKALYATKLEDVVAFAQKEGVTHFAYRTQALNGLDKQLFVPLNRKILPIFNAGKAQGFALRSPPPSSIVYRQGTTLILSMEKLAAAVAAGEPGEMIGPPPEPEKPVKGKPTAPVYGPQLPPGGLPRSLSPKAGRVDLERPRAPVERVRPADDGDDTDDGTSSIDADSEP